jgi:hypothetical protein
VRIVEVVKKKRVRKPLTEEQMKMQTESNKRYRERNRKKTNAQAYKQSAKIFLRKYAEEIDLKEFEELIKERRLFIKERRKKGLKDFEKEFKTEK